MAYTTLNAYDATTRIPEFKGLMQYGDGFSQDPRYASECENMMTDGGMLQPSASPLLLNAQLEQPIKTLAILHRIWYTGSDEKDIFIAASGGKLYSMTVSGNAWTQLAMPSGISAYQSDVWSYVAYEMLPAGESSMVDVLLLSNAKDGMICVRGDNLTVTTVETPKKFGVIARYAERIWGGAIDSDPDMLVYSAPYNPFDWTANTQIPEDGAGDVRQPSWDGDKFTALVQLGTQLIAFKANRVWRVLGTDPGEYVFREQYGHGASYFRTLAIDTARIFLLSKDGFMIYDGTDVVPFYQQYAQDVFKRMNHSYIDMSCACFWKGAYYCAIPIDGSQYNNAVVIYNTVENTFLLRTNVFVDAFLPSDESLYFTSSTTPGRIWKWRNNAWDTQEACAGSKWVTLWNDFGCKDIVKGGFTLYMNVAALDNVTMRISVETEKKKKTKTVTFPQSDNPRQKRIRFGGNGRRFRVSFEIVSPAPFKLVGGIQIVTEIDNE